MEYLYLDCQVTKKYIAEVEFDETEVSADDVYAAFKARFPEMNAKGYEETFFMTGSSLCVIYTITNWAFTEK